MVRGRAVQREDDGGEAVEVRRRATDRMSCSGWGFLARNLLYSCGNHAWRTDGYSQFLALNLKHQGAAEAARVTSCSDGRVYSRRGCIPAHRRWSLNFS